MRFALISDIHSNIEALTAVFDDIDARGIDRVFCLGDVVGYGPDPEACLDMIMARCEFTVKGNHDEALFTGADRFNPYARAAIEWTRDRLKPGLFRSRQNQARWTFLQDLPLEKRIDDMYFVHGSPRDHVNEYIHREDVFFNADEKLRPIFKTIDRVLFVGHTHLPVIITDKLQTAIPSDDGARFELNEGKYIVNVGSVGQPRDRDPRSCYLEVDGHDVIYHRIEYAIQPVIDKISRQNHLDSILGTRLLDGM